MLRRKPIQQGNTKKERIAQLLMNQSRRMTAREIAEIVGTTESNVFKEKSRLKTTGILSDSELTIFSQSDQNDSLTLAHAKATTLVTQTEYKSLTDIPPLSQNDLKKLYFEFMSGKTPVQIIAEFGFNPRLVELEYDRFLRLNGFRVTSLLSTVMAKYSLNSNQTAAAIIQKANHNGVLSNPDFLTIIEAVSSYSISLAEASFLDRLRLGSSIGPYKCFACSICGEPMVGAIFDEESEIGRNVGLVNGLLVHERCGGAL